MNIISILFLRFIVHIYTCLICTIIYNCSLHYRNIIVIYNNGVVTRAWDRNPDILIFFFNKFQNEVLGQHFKTVTGDRFKTT